MELTPKILLPRILISCIATALIFFSENQAHKCQKSSDRNQFVRMATEMPSYEDRALIAQKEMHARAEREGLIARGDYDVTYMLMGRDGKIPVSVFEKAELDGDQRIKAQAILDKAWESMTNLVRGNLSEEDVPGNPAEAGKIYRVRAFTKEGEVELESMRQAFRTEFGDKAATVLSRGLEPNGHSRQVKAWIADSTGD